MLLECVFIPARVILCVSCLGEEHARSSLKCAGCEHCDVLPLLTLRSRLAFFYNEGAHARVPQGSVPAVAKAQRRLQSWGSQIDLSAELETGTALSLPSPDRFSASSQGGEARAQTLQLSDSEELDVISFNARDTEDSPPQSRAYEELVEVVTSAVRLRIASGHRFVSQGYGSTWWPLRNIYG